MIDCIDSKKLKGTVLIGLLSVFFISWSVSCNPANSNRSLKLTEQLRLLADSIPGIVGIAVVSDKDTIVINNGIEYPMMSVFKLHQALAVASELEDSSVGLDSVLSVDISKLDRDTWSPMLKKYDSGNFDITVRELIQHAIIQSDNNASNLLFNHILPPSKVDTFIRTVAKDTSFSIKYSEAEMKKDHSLSYQNFTTPLSAALLIKQVFETGFLKENDQLFIQECLSKVSTGQNRVGIVSNEPEVKRFAHKTGSGFSNERGELIAHNDVGYFELANGTKYALSVFVRDFSGSEEEASEIIARISQMVYDYFR